MKLFKLLPIFLLLIISLSIYLPLVNIFFMQDRWLVMGKILSLKSGYILLDFPGILRTIFGEGRFLARVITYFLMINPFNPIPNNIYSIVFHTLNSLLVFKLINDITDNKRISFLTSLFFTASGVSFGAVIWPAASIVTLTSATFIIISLIYYFKFLKNGKNKHIFICFISLFISLQFKEIGIILFLIYPLGLILYKKIKIKNLLKRYWFPITALLFVIYYRISYFKKFTEPIALYLTGSNDNYLKTLLFRFFYYPLTSSSQTLVPAQILIPISRRLTDIFLPSYEGVSYLVMAETTVLDIVSLVLTFFVLFTVYFIYRKVNVLVKKNLLFFLIFVLSSFFPYIIIKKSFSYLDSRFYYLGVLGMSVLLAELFKAINVHKKSLVYMALLFLLIPHMLVVREEIKKQIDVSKVRKEFIIEFNQLEIKNSNKDTIFYVTGDTDYYLMGHKVPFQAGMGYILMVLYYNSGKIPIDLLKQGYLFEIGSQGYREVNGVGYGYFSDIDLLSAFVKNNNLNKDLIISLYYNSKTGELTKTVYDKK